MPSITYSLRFSVATRRCWLYSPMNSRHWRNSAWRRCISASWAMPSQVRKVVTAPTLASNSRVGKSTTINNLISALSAARRLQTHAFATNCKWWLTFLWLTYTLHSEWSRHYVLRQVPAGSCRWTCWRSRASADFHERHTGLHSGLHW